MFSSSLSLPSPQASSLSLSPSIPALLTYPCGHKHARGALLERKLSEAKVTHDGHEAEARELFLLVAIAANVIVVVVAATATAPSSSTASAATATAAPTRSRSDAATPVWCSKRDGERPAKRTERKRKRRRSNRRRRLLGRRAPTRRPPSREAPRGGLAIQHDGTRILLRFQINSLEK